MKNVGTFLDNSNDNIANHIQGFSIFNVVVQTVLLSMEYYCKVSIKNLEINFVSLGIFISWVFANKISNRYRLLYLYFTLVLQIIFLLNFKNLNADIFIFNILYLIIYILWIFIFCDIWTAVFINFIGLGLGSLCGTHYSNDNLNYILTIVLIIAIYAIYYRCFEAPKEDIQILQKDVDQIIDSKMNLINNIIHEIRNPLHGLLTITEILNNNNALSKSETKKQINIVYNTVEHLSKMTNDLLDYAKFNAGKMTFNYEVINLIRIIRDNAQRSEDLYLNLSNKNLKIIFMDNNIKEALIWGDELKINQLLNNLLLNAIKYSNNGKIIVKINKISQVKAKGNWELTVIDDGIGIQKSDLKTIFDPFVRGVKVENANIGTGLGLTFCRDIVQKHHGKIWAENNKNKNGAVFTIILPIYE